MSRAINVSTGVFAGIWARRQEGEETEDAILARLLGVDRVADEANAPAPAAVSANGGVHDTRNGVHFPRGFIAYRRYKGRDYEAVAGDGTWMRSDNGEAFPTLNQLNASIAAGAENIWNGNWKYRDDSGKLRSINDLRR